VPASFYRSDRQTPTFDAGRRDRHRRRSVSVSIVRP